MQATVDTGPTAGKVCLVTGATAGIGEITATALAAQSAEVIVGGRNQQKAETTAQRIIAKTGNEAVGYLLADFSVPLSYDKEVAQQLWTVSETLIST